jgi:hypothetical protein
MDETIISLTAREPDATVALARALDAVAALDVVDIRSVSAVFDAEDGEAALVAVAARTELDAPDLLEAVRAAVSPDATAAIALAGEDEWTRPIVVPHPELGLDRGLTAAVVQLAADSRLPDGRLLGAVYETEEEPIGQLERPAGAPDIPDDPRAYADEVLDDDLFDDVADPEALLAAEDAVAGRTPRQRVRPGPVRSWPKPDARWVPVLATPPRIHEVTAAMALGPALDVLEGLGIPVGFDPYDPRSNVRASLEQTIGSRPFALMVREDDLEEAREAIAEAGALPDPSIYGGISAAGLAVAGVWMPTGSGTLTEDGPVDTEDPMSGNQKRENAHRQREAHHAAEHHHGATKPQHVEEHPVPEHEDLYSITSTDTAKSPWGRALVWGVVIVFVVFILAIGIVSFGWRFW